MPIADQSDVEALLQRPLTATEVTYLPALLTRADALIARYLPYVRFVGALANQTTSLRGTGTFEIWLPGRPVTNVDSISLDGDPLEAYVDYDWSEWGDVARLPENLVWPLGGSIAVQWDYGFVTAPEDVVAVAADMVRWAVTNPTGVRQESVGQGYGVTYAAETVASAVALTADHRKILDHYHYPVAI